MSILFNRCYNGAGQSFDYTEELGMTYRIDLSEAVKIIEKAIPYMKKPKPKKQIRIPYSQRYSVLRTVSVIEMSESMYKGVLKEYGSIQNYLSSVIGDVVAL